MVYRVEIGSKVLDARSSVRKNKFEGRGFAGKINSIEVVDVYTIDMSLSEEEIKKVSLPTDKPGTTGFHGNLVLKH